ncbi:MAG: TlpA family protein disulfide reductase [Ignavibacteriales bacterium]|nr:TlpA family protein disulfide reductase [Ignavibacteriales bacterium]
MKAFLLSLVGMCIFACSVTLRSSEADRPIAGKSYYLLYDPSKTGKLSDAHQLWVVYALDYWGTKAVQKLRGEGEETDLFENVLDPDSERASRVEMVKRGKLWRAEISIPANAALLSYYITDGIRNDFNNQKTFVSYVYNENGKPVRGARFRNIDFLLMSGRGVPSILQEIRNEIGDYPDHFLAHMVYWRFRFFETISPDSISLLLSELDQHFSRLQNQFGDSVLNYKAMSLNDVNRVIQLSFRDRLKEPTVVAITKSVNTGILLSVESIPAEKRLPQVARLAPFAQYMLLPPEERERIQLESQRRFEQMMAEFVGQPAPEFSFETTTGTKHDLSDFRGSFILLDFWGSWCGPCVQDIPNLVKIHEKFSQNGLVMISISNDASVNKWDRAKLSEYTEKKGMKWIQVLDDPSNLIHGLYKIQAWPNLFLIDREGKVLQRQALRGDDLVKTLSKLLEK